MAVSAPPLFRLSFILLLASLAAPGATKIDLHLTNAATTIVLTNEGGLVDKLIAAGYGPCSLYDTLVALQISSNGVVSDGFMATLAQTYPSSNVYTRNLSLYAGTTTPIAINTDGTVSTTSISASGHIGQTGYATYTEVAPGVGTILYTYATGESYYIGTGTGSYKAFAIVSAAASTSATPLPPSAWLMLTGLGGAAAFHWRRRFQSQG
jgi:hypothetical protein